MMRDPDDFDGDGVDDDEEGDEERCSCRRYRWTDRRAFECPARQCLMTSLTRGAVFLPLAVGLGFLVGPGSWAHLITSLILALLFIFGLIDPLMPWWRDSWRERVND